MARCGRENEVLAAASILLDQKDIVDLAVEDLRKWGAWEHTDRVRAFRPVWIWRADQAITLVLLELSPKNDRTLTVRSGSQEEDAQYVDEVLELLRLETPRPDATPNHQKIADSRKQSTMIRRSLLSLLCLVVRGRSGSGHVPCAPALPAVALLWREGREFSKAGPFGTLSILETIRTVPPHRSADRKRPRERPRPGKLQVADRPAVYASRPEITAEVPGFLRCDQRTNRRLSSSPANPRRSSNTYAASLRCQRSHQAIAVRFSIPRQ